MYKISGSTGCKCYITNACVALTLQRCQAHRSCKDACTTVSQWYKVPRMFGKENKNKQTKKAIRD